jgi:hypothetical protein
LVWDDGCMDCFGTPLLLLALGILWMTRLLKENITG